MEAIIIGLAAKYTWVVTICLVLGAFRLVFKPLMALIDSIVEFTPSKADDTAWGKIKESKIYKGIVWFVDYIVSIKLPVVKPEATSNVRGS